MRMSQRIMGSQAEYVLVPNLLNFFATASKPAKTVQTTVPGSMQVPLKVTMMPQVCIKRRVVWDKAKRHHHL
jgi:hypothetical protein